MTLGCNIPRQLTYFAITTCRCYVAGNHASPIDDAPQASSSTAEMSCKSLSFTTLYGDCPHIRTWTAFLATRVCLITAATYLDQLFSVWKSSCDKGTIFGNMLRAAASIVSIPACRLAFKMHVVCTELLHLLPDCIQIGTCRFRNLIAVGSCIFNGYAQKDLTAAHCCCYRVWSWTSHTLLLLKSLQQHRTPHMLLSLHKLQRYRRFQTPQVLKGLQHYEASHALLLVQAAQRKAAEAGTEQAEAERQAGEERQKAGQALQAHQTAIDALQLRLQAAQVAFINQHFVYR